MPGLTSRLSAAKSLTMNLGEQVPTACRAEQRGKEGRKEKKREEKKKERENTKVNPVNLIATGFAFAIEM